MRLTGKMLEDEVAAKTVLVFRYFRFDPSRLAGC